MFKFVLLVGVFVHPLPIMDTNGQVGHDQEMDFHLETTDDIDLDDESTSPNQNSSQVKFMGGEERMMQQFFNITLCILFSVDGSFRYL